MHGELAVAEGALADKGDPRQDREIRVGGDAVEEAGGKGIGTDRGGIGQQERRAIEEGVRIRERSIQREIKYRTTVGVLQGYENRAVEASAGSF